MVKVIKVERTAKDILEEIKTHANQQIEKG